MDILVLIDRLDDLVHNAKSVPLSDQVRIDREEIYDILDQIRATLPEEIKAARAILERRDEILAEAERLLAEARVSSPAVAPPLASEPADDEAGSTLFRPPEE